MFSKCLKVACLHSDTLPLSDIVVSKRTNHTKEAVEPFAESLIIVVVNVLPSSASPRFVFRYNSSASRTDFLKGHLESLFLAAVHRSLHVGLARPSSSKGSYRRFLWTTWTNISTYLGCDPCPSCNGADMDRQNVPSTNQEVGASVWCSQPPKRRLSTRIRPFLPRRKNFKTKGQV